MRTVIITTLALQMLPALADTVLDEILVTAQKREQNVIDVPISLSVLSGTYIEDRNFDTLEQVSANQPSVTVSPNSAASKIYMRGIGSQGNAGLDQSVSIYVDDVYHGRSRNMKSALVDIERIEFLKGPQSTYFGLNSSAGAIAVQTRNADFDSTNGYARATFGTDGALGTRIAYNRPMNEQFAVRAVVDWSTLDGYWNMVDPATGSAQGDSWVLSYRIS